MPRMQILTAAEQQAFDTPPVFSGTERETFFHVSDSLREVLATFYATRRIVSVWC